MAFTARLKKLAILSLGILEQFDDDEINLSNPTDEELNTIQKALQAKQTEKDRLQESINNIEKEIKVVNEALKKMELQSTSKSVNVDARKRATKLYQKLENNKKDLQEDQRILELKQQIVEEFNTLPQEEKERRILKDIRTKRPKKQIKVEQTEEEKALEFQKNQQKKREQYGKKFKKDERTELTPEQQQKKEKKEQSKEIEDESKRQQREEVVKNLTFSEPSEYEPTIREFNLPFKPRPENPAYIGSRKDMVSFPEGDWRTYEGGGIQVRVCPVCGYDNNIYTTRCENCAEVYKKLTNIITDPDWNTKIPVDINSKPSRLAFFDATKTLIGGDYGAPTLDKIYTTSGITMLGNDTINEVPPTNPKRTDKAVYELNAKRDEKGDLIIDPKTNLPIPLPKEEQNWLKLEDILKKLSVKEAGTEDAELNIDEFYEQVMEFNKNSSTKIGHIPIGAGYTMVGGKDILPESTYKGEQGRVETVDTISTDDEGNEYYITTPNSKSGGYYSVWPWNDYLSPSGKHMAGVATVFADRIAKLEKLKILSRKNNLESNLQKNLDKKRELEETLKALNKQVDLDTQLKRLKQIRSVGLEPYLDAQREKVIFQARENGKDLPEAENLAEKYVATQRQKVEQIEKSRGKHLNQIEENISEANTNFSNSISQLEEAKKQYLEFMMEQAKSTFESEEERNKYLQGLAERLEKNQNKEEPS